MSPKNLSSIKPISIVLVYRGPFLIFMGVWFWYNRSSPESKCEIPRTHKNSAEETNNNVNNGWNNQTKPMFDFIAETVTAAFQIVDANIVWTLLIPLLYVLLAHRLSLYRDRRKEYNVIADEIREVLHNEFMALPTATNGLSAAQVDKLHAVQLCWFGFRWIYSLRIHFAYCHYHKQKGRHAQGCPYKNPEAVEEAINTMLNFAKKA